MPGTAGQVAEQDPKNRELMARQENALQQLVLMALNDNPIVVEQTCATLRKCSNSLPAGRPEAGAALCHCAFMTWLLRGSLLFPSVWPTTLEGNPACLHAGSFLFGRWVGGRLQQWIAPQPPGHPSLPQPPLAPVPLRHALEAYKLTCSPLCMPAGWHCCRAAGAAQSSASGVYSGE